MGRLEYDFESDSMLNNPLTLKFSEYRMKIELYDFYTSDVIKVIEFQVDLIGFGYGDRIVEYRDTDGGYTVEMGFQQRKGGREK